MLDNNDKLEFLYEFDKLEDEYSSFIKRLINDNPFKDIEHKKTALSLSNLIVSINSIKLGILDLAKSENMYSIYILYRSYLEHYIKIFYIFLSYAEINSDNIGNEYLTYSKIYEYLGLIKKIKNVIILNEYQEIKESDYEILLKGDPDLKQYNLSDINKIANKFKMFSMIQYIYKRPDEFIKEHELSSLKNFLDEALPEYSMFSSFVHGGPNTIYHLAQYNDIELVIKEIKKIIKNIYLSEFLLRQMVILFFCKYKPEFYKEILLQKSIVSKFFKILNGV